MSFIQKLSIIIGDYIGKITVPDFQLIEEGGGIIPNHLRNYIVLLIAYNKTNII